MPRVTKFPNRNTHTLPSLAERPALTALMLPGAVFCLDRLQQGLAVLAHITHLRTEELGVREEGKFAERAARQALRLDRTEE